MTRIRFRLNGVETDVDERSIDAATALLAQFTTGKLLYTISVGAPPGSTGGVGAPTASDEGVVTRIVSSMQ